MIKIQKYIIVICTLCLILFNSNAYSQEILGNSIAVINIEKVERASVAWNSLTTQINEKRISFQNEVGKLQNQLKAKGDEIETQRALLSSEAFSVKVKEFQNERANLQQETSKRKQLLDQVYAKGRQQIRTALNKVIISYSAAENIDLVLNIGSKAGVVHYARMEKLDISKQILEILNSEIQTVDLAGQ